MSELKRCPFCDKTLIADCKQFFIHPIVGCLMDGIPIKNDAESLKRWNTRKPMQNIVEQLEKEDYQKDGGELFLNHNLEDCIPLRRVYEIIKGENGLHETETM